MLLRVSSLATSRKYRRPLMRWDFISKSRETTASQLLPPLSSPWPISWISQKKWSSRRREREGEEEGGGTARIRNGLVGYVFNQLLQIFFPLFPPSAPKLLTETLTVDRLDTRITFSYEFLRREVLLTLYWWSYSSWLNVTVGQF